MSEPSDSDRNQDTTTDQVNQGHAVSGEIIAELKPSAARRFAGIGMMAILGCLVIYIALSRPPEKLLIQAILVIVGLGALYLGDKLRQATKVSLVLTEEGVFESTGRSVVLMEEIEKVDRATFTIKPSNGLSIITKEKMSRVWAPGLWWRVGRKIGIGGVTSASQSKNMTQALTVLIARRDGLI